MAVIYTQKKEMKIGYNRVSTIQQNLETSHAKLANLGAEIIFEEKKSGSKKENRKELKRLIKFLEKNKDEYEIEVLVLKVDRLARSIIDLRTIVDDILKTDASLTFVENNLHFDNKKENNVMNQMMLNFLGAFAEMERDMIVSRTQAGLAFQRKNNPNFKTGRKRKLSDEQISIAIDLMKTKSANDVAKTFNISKKTLYNYINAIKSS